MQLPATWPGIVLLVLLVCAILGGAVTAFVRLTDRNTAIDIGLLHGRLGITGILLLFLLMMTGNEFNQSIRPALGFLALTAMAGAALYFIIRRKGILPKTITLAHGAFAVISLVVLLGVLS